MMGFTFGFGAPMGYAAAAGRIDAAWAALYAAAILWDLGFDTIYAHQDREDDALVGVRSTARLFGERTRPFLAACYAAAVVAAGAGRLAGRARRLVLSRRWCCRPACWRGRWSRWTSTIPAGCLRLFRANREVGLAVGAGDPGGLALIDAAGVHPRQHRPGHRAAMCRKSGCTWPPRSRRSGRRPRPGWPNATSSRRSGRSPGRAGRRWRGTSWTTRSWSPASACWISPPAAASPRSPARWPAPRWVEAAEIDDLALAAIALNAAANGVQVRPERRRGRRGLPLGPDPVRRRLLRGADDRPHPALAARWRARPRCGSPILAGPICRKPGLQALGALPDRDHAGTGGPHLSATSRSTGSWRAVDRTARR